MCIPKKKTDEPELVFLRSIFGIWLPRPSLSLSLCLSPGADLCVSEGLKCPRFTLKPSIESFVFPTGHLITIFLGESVLETPLLKAPRFVFFVIVVKWQLYGFLDELGYHPEKTEAKTFNAKASLQAFRDPHLSAECFFTSFLFNIYSFRSVTLYSID